MHIYRFFSLELVVQPRLQRLSTAHRLQPSGTAQPIGCAAQIEKLSFSVSFHPCNSTHPSIRERSSGGTEAGGASDSVELGFGGRSSPGDSTLWEVAGGRRVANRVIWDNDNPARLHLRVLPPLTPAAGLLGHIQHLRPFINPLCRSSCLAR